MTPGRLLYAGILAGAVALLGYRVLSEAAEGDRVLPEDAIERLEAAPLDGDAFGDLAVASQSAGDAADALALHTIAARRDPRDLRVRAWLADVHMRSGDYPEALEQIDAVLRLSRDARKVLPPLMVQWSDDPGFAEALVTVLRSRPEWRRDMDKALRENILRPGASAVFAGLDASGGIDDKEAARWIESLLHAGNWGLAYSFWAGRLDLAPGEPLPMLYNGGFEQAPTQQGFDWRTERRSGTYTEFGPAEGANRDAAHLVFHGRPVAYANLEQAMVLPPGRYRLSMRTKAVALRTDQGLRWSLTCHGRSRPQATGERLDGSFEWREEVLEFEIPTEQCPGQWLRIENPAPRGTARMVSGELWIDDMTLRAGDLAGQAAR